jgi:hypothetical protein
VKENAVLLGAHQARIARCPTAGKQDSSAPIEKDISVSLKKVSFKTPLSDLSLVGKYI